MSKMLKLMKYELRKTWFTKAVLLGITAVAELAFLYGLYGENETTLSISVLLLTFLAFGGLLIMGLESIVTLHRDMNTRQSYMLFMTPNSCYRILGAKVLECGASILLAGAFFLALGVLDITLLFGKMGQLNQLWEMIKELLSSFTIGGRKIEIDLRSVAAVIFQLSTAWISMVTTAYLAVVISAALLNGRKHNGIISFLFFLLLSWFTGWITQTLTAPIRNVFDVLIVYGLISLAFAAIQYVVTAWIMDRRLSV